MNLNVNVTPHTTPPASPKTDGPVAGPATGDPAPGADARHGPFGRQFAMMEAVTLESGGIQFTIDDPLAVSFDVGKILSESSPETSNTVMGDALRVVMVGCVWTRNGQRIERPNTTLVITSAIMLTRWVDTLGKSAAPTRS